MRRPVLILSNPRTGSTLLRLLLDTHPALCSPAELSLGKLCDGLYATVEATLGQTSSDRAARRARCLSETRAIVDGLLGRYCASKGKERWCEKSPWNVEFLEMLTAVFPDAKYLCFHRHCLDTVRSMVEFYGPSPPELAAYVERNHGDTIAAFIERWCDHTEKLIAFEEERPDCALRLRYEDLAADPDAALRPVLEFIEVEWVPGLAQKVFASPHDLGRGDPKVTVSTRVASDRTGHGSRLDVSGTPERVLRRMRQLLTILHYPDSLEPAVSPERSAERRELTSVGELFASCFPHQLARYRERLASAACSLTIIVNGADEGAWTIAIDAGGARILDRAGEAPLTMVIDSADLLAIVNRRLTLVEFRDRIRIRGSLALFDGPLLERLMWVLFGEDLRPLPPPGAWAGTGVELREATRA